MLTIIILSVIGSFIAALVGTFWYSQATPMGRLHMRVIGFAKLSPEEQKALIEKAKPQMPKVYGAQLALSLLTSFFTVFVVTLSIQNGVPASTAVLFPVFGWLCFVVPTIGQAILWGNIDRSLAWKKFASDSASNLLTILLIAGLAVLFA